MSLDDAFEDASWKETPPRRTRGARQGSSRDEHGQQQSSASYPLAATAAMESGSREATKRSSFSDQRMALPGAPGGKARRESVEEVGRGALFDNAPDDRSSARKMKRSWWKK